MKAAIGDRRNEQCGRFASRSRKRRLASVVLTAVGLLALSELHVRSQDPPPQLAPPRQAPAIPIPAVPQPQGIQQLPIPGMQRVRGRDGGGERPNLFVTDRTAARRLKLAESRLSNGVYEEAVDLLQMILDSDEDAAAPPDAETPVFRSLKRQAIDLLSKLPAEGRRIYELKYGVAARGKLDESLKEGDWGGVEAVSRRYFHTVAGREATYRLAVWADDRGESLEAALLFQRLVDDGLTPFEPRLSLRAAAAWSKAGMDDLALKAAERYLKLAANQLAALPEIGTEAKSPAQLVSRLKTMAGVAAGSSEPTWPMFGGDAGRLSNVAPVSIAEGAAWSRRLHEPNEWDDAREAARVSRLAVGLDLLTKSARAQGDLTQAAFHPVVAQNAAIFRTLRNIQAVDLASGKLLWQTEPPHDQFLDKAIDELSLLISLGESDISSFSFGDAVAQFAWENLTSGMIATDGRFVYGIEGTGRAGTTQMIVQGMGRPVSLGDGDFNTLVAYELAAEGRIAWTAGGPPAKDDPSRGVFFLGPPLPLGGRLYALAERDGLIRLLAMDPVADPGSRVVWSQTLVETDLPLTARPQRRISGLSPAFADGILVCPTGAGAVVGVDLARRVLLWGYEYAGGPGSPIEPNNPAFFFGNSSIATNQPRWLDSVPHIADGAVFITPMDSDEVHCLDLKTGDVRWKHPREALLYLAAVHDGKAVFAGRNSLLAVDAQTGETVWEQPLDEMPAGRGVRSGDLYHLPLISGEVATIRLSNHQELARSPVGSGLVPGNLIAVQGRLLSLSTDAIVGFERSTERDDARRDAAALDRAASSDELALQGMRALHRGDVENGLSLLRRAATEGGSSEAKRSYVHVLLEGLRADFARYQKYERDLRQIIDDPHQKAAFYRLLANGLETAGDASGAFDALLRLATSDVAGPEHVFAGSDRLVRSDRLDRARLEQMQENASDSDRVAMQLHVQNAVRRAIEARDAESLERLVALLEPAEPRTAALEALETIYNESGAMRKLERVRMQLGVAASVKPRDTSITRRFDVAWQAEYVPAEIKTVRKDSPTPASLSVPIVGSVPKFCKGWQFALSENAQTLIARDAFGRERWRLPLDRDRSSAGPNPFGGRPASPGRAHIRFSGHLLAVLVGTRVLMLDVLSEAESPPVLWSADLSARTYSMVFINRRVMNEPADGPMAFAGSRLFLYEGGGALNAVDPLTGDLFWRRIGFPDDCELSGDDEFVTVQLPGGGDVFVIDAADGRIVAQRAIPQPFQRLGWFGTQMVTARREQQAIEIASEDVARETRRWSLRFPEASLIAQCGSNEIAVLEPAAGRLQLIDSADGSIVLEAKIESDAAIAEIAVTRHFERVVLLTRREEPAGLVRVETDRTRSPVNGLAYGFDDHGNRIWSAAIRQQYADLQQPLGLPVLALTATRIGLQGQRTHHVAILDVRNGQLLIEQRRLSEFEPIVLSADPELPSISIDCQGAKFLLTPSEKPLPEPRTDGLAEFTALTRELPVAQP